MKNVSHYSLKIQAMYIQPMWYFDVKLNAKKKKEHKRFVQREKICIKKISAWLFWWTRKNASACVYST